MRWQYASVQFPKETTMSPELIQEPSTIFNALSNMVGVDCDHSNTKIVSLFNNEHLQSVVNDYVSMLLDETRPVKFIVFYLGSKELKERMKLVGAKVTAAFPHLYSAPATFDDSLLVYYHENVFNQLAIRKELIKLNDVKFSVRCLKLSKSLMIGKDNRYSELIANEISSMNLNSEQYLILAVDDKISHATLASNQMDESLTKLLITFLVSSVLPRIETNSGLEVLYKTIGLLTARHVYSGGFKHNGFHITNLDNFESISLVEFNDKNLPK